MDTQTKKAVALIGMVSPAAASIADPQKGDPHLGSAIIPGAALGVAGFFAWKEHPILGFYAGDALGLNLYRLYRSHGGDHARALTNLSVAGAAVAGSLMWKKHPFWGWALGHLAGSIATAFIEGSTANKAWREFNR